MSGYAATTNLAEALAGGYIGEILIAPKQIADAVHQALTGKRIRPHLVFFYGERDAELSELFGYSPP